MGVSEGVDVVKSTVEDPKGPDASRERVEWESDEGVAVIVIVVGLMLESSVMASSRLPERMIVLSATASLANGISSLLVGA